MVPPISLACAQCGNLPDCKSENRRSLQGVSMWSKREKDLLKEQSVSAPRGRIQECVPRNIKSAHLLERATRREQFINTVRFKMNNVY